MKFVLYILLLLSSHLSCASTRVIFLNGIDGFAEKSIASREKIQGILFSAGYLGRFEDARFSYWMNPGDGPIDDKLELMAQAINSGAALTYAKLTNKSATPESDEYQAALGSLYFNKISGGAGDSEDERHVYSIVRGFAAYLYEQVFEKGNLVIVVAHSQGNFFSEAVAAYLRHTLTPEQLLAFRIKVRFVGVASVAASTPNGRYISAQEDKALDAHILATAAIPNFHVLPRNSNLCPIVDVACLTSLLTTDLSIHGFLEIYTSDFADRDSGLPLSKILSNKIVESLTEISSANYKLDDDFSGLVLRAESWNSLSCGSAYPVVSAGNVTLGPCAYTTTKGKVEFSASKIVVEARLVGPKESGRDTAISLVDATTGDRIQIGDTNYKGMSESGFGAYVLGTGVFNREQVPSPLPSTNQWKVYRVTFDGSSVTVQRGDSLDALSETYTVGLPSSIAGHTFYLKLSTGAADGTYSPGQFDWIRVKTF